MSEKKTYFTTDNVQGVAVKLSKGIPATSIADVASAPNVGDSVLVGAATAVGTATVGSVGATAIVGSVGATAIVGSVVAGLANAAVAGTTRIEPRTEIGREALRRFTVDFEAVDRAFTQAMKRHGR